jgi:bacterioferritin (cytochrome b1)
MPKKTQKAKKTNTGEEFTEVLHEVLKHMDKRFDEAATGLASVEERLTVQLDEIHFSVSGQERRISTLEDRMRMVATKLGLEFRKNV